MNRAAEIFLAVLIWVVYAVVWVITEVCEKWERLSK